MVDRRKKTFDTLVIGSGASGGWVAKELAERGLTVLMLEAGPDGVVLSGIAALERLSVEQCGHGFLSIDESQATKLVSTITTEKSDSPLRRFYEVTRTEAVRGYYTSAEGRKELDY